MSSSTASATTTPATTSNKNHNNENTRPEQKRTGRRRRIAVGKDESTNEEEEDYVDKDEDENTENFNNWKDFSQLRLLHKERRSRSVPTILGSIGTTGEDTGLYTCSLCQFMNIFCLGVYGVLQERVMTIPYESSKNNDELGTQYPDAIFASSIFLVLSNRVSHYSYVWHFFTPRLHLRKRVVIILSVKRNIGGGQIQVWRTTRVAFSNLVSTLCQYEVLKYLSYAISTLAAKAKILPTMFWGFILHGRRFRSSQYLSAMLVTVGCFVFVFNSSLAAKYTSEGITTEDEEGYDNPYTNNNRLDDGDDNANEHGVLSEDPVVSAIFKEENDINAVFWKERALVVRRSLFQRAIGTFRSFGSPLRLHRRVHNARLPHRGRVYQLISAENVSQKTSLFDQMFWTCVFGTFFQRSVGRPFWAVGIAILFLHRYPKIIPDIFYLSMASALAQVSITYTVRAFGAVTLASVMTVRQVVSISLNVSLSRALVALQWVGLGLIFLLPVFSAALGIRKSWKWKVLRR